MPFNDMTFTDWTAEVNRVLKQVGKDELNATHDQEAEELYDNGASPHEGAVAILEEELGDTADEVNQIKDMPDFVSTEE